MITSLAVDAAEVQGVCVVHKKNLNPFFKKNPRCFPEFPFLSFLPEQATGVRLAMLLQCFSNICASVIISFVVSWELTLLCLSVVPFLTITTIAEMRTLTDQAAQEKKDLEVAGKVRGFHSVQALNSNSFVLGDQQWHGITFSIKNM